MARLLPTVLILGMIYADVAAIANLTNWSIRLPVPQTVFRYFAMFRVFDSWDDENSEYVAEVKLLQLEPMPEASEWRRFDLYALFPAPPADARIRIGGIFRRDAASVMGEIWDAYEQSHPGEIVDSVRIYIERWPKSAAGYEAARKQATRQLIGEL